jgi:hypothetical protein
MYEVPGQPAGPTWLKQGPSATSRNLQRISRSPLAARVTPEARGPWPSMACGIVCPQPTKVDITAAVGNFAAALRWHGLKAAVLAPLRGRCWHRSTVPSHGPGSCGPLAPGVTAAAWHVAPSSGRWERQSTHSGFRPSYRAGPGVAGPVRGRGLVLVHGVSVLGVGRLGRRSHCVIALIP